MLENADAATVTAMLQYGQGDIGNGGEPQISEGVTAGIFEELMFRLAMPALPMAPYLAQGGA